MELENEFQRFLDLRSYIGWTEEDDACSEELSRLLIPHTDRMLDDFYDEVKKHPASWRVITGGDAQIRRLRESLALWLTDTLQSPHNRDYVIRRWKIGYRHVEIGLDQLYVNAAFTRVRARLNEILYQSMELSQERKIKLLNSLNKRLDMDLAIMTAAYQSEYQSRQIPVDHARLRQQRFLARLSREALADADLNRIYDQAVAYLGEAFQADLVEYMQWDPLSNRLVLKSSSGWPEEAIGQVFAPETSGQTWARLFEKSEPVFVDDWEMQTDWTYPESLRSSGVVSSLFQVVGDEEVQDGILGIHFRQRRQVLPSDRDFLSSIGNLLANAIHRKRTERQKLENASQMRRLVDLLPAGAVYVVHDTLQVNQAVEKMIGLPQEELAKREAWDKLILSEEEKEPPTSLPHEQLGNGMMVHKELEVRRADGQQRLISQIKFQSSTDEIWLLNDVTEETERRSRELQAERLAAIGQMITGLAHESRNALQRIQACTELLELQLDEDEGTLALLGRLQQAQDDLHLLFDEVRNYASPLSLAKQSHTLNQILAEAWSQIEPVRKGRDASLECSLSPAEIELEVDRFRLVQVFRNFFENSLAACEDPVRIEVSACCRETSEQTVARISIRDNGPGFGDDVASKMFEPFFTTKTKGSGLGMAIASRLIAAHQGTIRAISHPDKGAEFEMTIPMG